MRKVLLCLVLSFTLAGCTTINPDGSETRGRRGSINWIISAPLKYSIDYFKNSDTWRICEIWDETYSTEPWIKGNSLMKNPKYGKSNGLAMRRVLAKTLESRGEDPMICRSTRN